MNRNVRLAGAMIGLSISSFALAQGRRYGFGAQNTPGWSMMTPGERGEYRKEMVSRATAKGMTLGVPRFDTCD